MMKRVIGSSLLVVAALSATTVAQAQARYIGVDAGVYFPSSGTLRDALGDSWFSIGATTMRAGVQQSRSLGTNWNVISKTNGGNKVFMGSYSLGLFQPLGDVRDSARPFFALRGGLSYIDYAIGPQSDRISGKRIGYNANVEAGFMFGDRLTLSARYDVFSEHSGLNFDGLSFSLRYGLASF